MIRLAITAILGVSITALAERPPQVAGVVRSATTGEALPNATVLLASRGAALKLSRTTSGADGSFGFSGLASGVYQLTVRKPGYEVFEAGAPITILSEGADAVRLAPALRPCGAISGRAVDWEGEPVAEAEVRAYALVYQPSGATLSLAAKGESNDLGEYRLFDLPAGKYVIQVSPPRAATPSGQFYANTPAAYYPGAPLPAQALPIDLHWGEEITQADVKMQQGQSYAIAGVVWDAQAQGPCTRCLVQAVQHDGQFRISLSQTARVSREGTFVLRGLSAGDYTLVGRQGSSKGAVAQAPASIRNRHVEDARLVVGVQQPVTGALVLEKPPEGLDTSGWTVRLSPWALPEWWPGENGSVDTNQQFTIPGVSPARYRFELAGLPRGAYLKALRLGGQPLKGSEIIVSQQTPTSDLEAVIGFDGAAVQGKVRPADNDAIPARVFLLPPPDQSASHPAASTETAPDGSFSFGSIPPGGYTLLALPASAAVQILDPAVQAALARYATTVRLDPNQTINIEVPLAAAPR